MTDKPFLAAFLGIGTAITRRHNGGNCQRLLGAMHADHGGIAAAMLGRVIHHAMVILLPHPAAAGHIGRGNDFFQ